MMLSCCGLTIRSERVLTIMITFRMEEGDCCVFDNLRVLHGRDGFTLPPLEPGMREREVGRHLQGCYVDWDEIHDRINILSASTKLF